jgi:hypothetical protein
MEIVHPEALQLNIFGMASNGVVSGNLPQSPDRPDIQNIVNVLILKPTGYHVQKNLEAPLTIEVAAALLGGSGLSACHLTPKDPLPLRET